jgi:hypothetical protein
MKKNRYSLIGSSIFFMALVLAACSQSDKKAESSSDTQCEKLSSSHILPPSAEPCDIEFKKVGVCAKITPSENPIPVGKPFSYQFKIWEKYTGAAQALDSDPALKVCARLWMYMPSGSHGAPKVKVSAATTRSGDVVAGEYEFKNVTFTMRSESSDEYWEVQIKIKKGDGSFADEAVYRPHI